MPIDLPALRAALPIILRGWYRADFAPEPFTQSVYLTEYLQSDAALVPAETRREHVKAMVRAAMHNLQASNAEWARLLRDRYLKGTQRGQVTSDAVKEGRRGTTLSRVKHAQEQALDALARQIILLEETAARERVARITAGLDIGLGPQIFGQSECLAELLGALRDPRGRWVVSLEGIGGLGKTTLATAAVHHFIPEPDFVGILWVSARQVFFALSAGVRQELHRTAALTYPQLLVELARELDPDSASGRQSAEQVVRAHLKARPHLVVVDNLETVPDYQVLVPELVSLAGPSKFLLTSRARVQGTPEVYSIRLAELGERDIIDLVRATARAQDLQALAEESDETLKAIYAVVGGNPLAAKLVVGQAHVLGLDQLLAELGAARNRSADELFRYVYWHSWHTLSEPARAVLLAMPLLAAGGGQLDQIVQGTGLAQEVVLEALSELARHALVEVGGTARVRRYGVHRLTETFVTHEVLKWSPEPPPAS
jgi:hypothetical protein